MVLSFSLDSERLGGADMQQARRIGQRLVEIIYQPDLLPAECRLQTTVESRRLCAIGGSNSMVVSV